MTIHHGLFAGRSVQADTTNSRRFEGTGLGLAIVYRLVAMMGGNITLESREGQGTEVSFTVTIGSETPPEFMSNG